MDIETFFLAQLQQLAQLATDPRTMAPVEASGVLRRLLLDNPTVVHQINKQYRLKLAFFIRPAGDGPPLGPRAWFVADALDPEIFQGPSAHLSLDGFLASKVGSVDARAITAKEVILHAAHVWGGIHRYPAKQEYERAIAQLEAELPGLTQLSLDRILRALSRITLRALVPLRNAALNAARFDGAVGAAILTDVRMIELGEDADVRVVQLGNAPSMRVTVDPRGRVRLTVRDERGSRLTLEGPHVTVGQNAWITAELGVDGEDVALRVRVNGIDIMDVFPGAAKLVRSTSVVTTPFRMVMGESPIGTFEVAEHLVYSNFLPRETREKLHEWCRTREPPKQVIRLAPGQGFKTPTSGDQ